MTWRVSRTVTIAVQALVIPAVFVGAPLALSRKGKRHGWSADGPGAANLLGTVPVGAGSALLAWTLYCHYRAAPRGWEVSMTPDYLLAGGPYRFSRNPMYVAEGAIWAGWAVLFGSLPVSTGLLVLTLVQNGAVRMEERMLSRRWGRAYDDYRATVPRWLVLPHPPRGPAAR